MNRYRAVLFLPCEVTAESAAEAAKRVNYHAKMIGRTFPKRGLRVIETDPPHATVNVAPVAVLTGESK